LQNNPHAQLAVDVHQPEVALLLVETGILEQNKPSKGNQTVVETNTFSTSLSPSLEWK
jgi:hypothetical protein